MAIVDAETEVLSYTLHLTPDEAEAVLSVLGHVGGVIADTRRLYTESVFKALKRAGVRLRLPLTEEYDLSGCVTFHKKPLLKQKKTYTFVKEWT